MYLEDFEDDTNPGVVRANDGVVPSSDDYGDMLTDDRPEDDDEEAVDKYLNVELIMHTGNNDERRWRGHWESPCEPSL
jgi:hypothetical protein